MALRTIMIFPEFENMKSIDNLRNQYDPLSDSVHPHITLVFPFDSEMTNEELTKILERRLANVKPFEVKLSGISRHEDFYGNFLFLDVIQGAEEICTIHNSLYENKFSEFASGAQFTPHITVGKLASVQQLDDAYKIEKDMNETFIAIVNKISVELIGENEESIIVIEKKLTK
jgi:2'-5' RNA ligase